MYQIGLIACPYCGSQLLFEPSALGECLDEQCEHLAHLEVNDAGEVLRLLGDDISGNLVAGVNNELDGLEYRICRVTAPKGYGLSAIFSDCDDFWCAMAYLRASLLQPVVGLPVGRSNPPA